jgi:hypothetical protein
LTKVDPVGERVFRSPVTSKINDVRLGVAKWLNARTFSLTMSLYDSQAEDLPKGADDGTWNLSAGDLARDCVFPI